MGNVIHIYHAEDYGVIAEWQGGEYVQLYAVTDDFRGHIVDIMTGEAVPYDVLNVWDYELGAPRIAPDELDLVVEAALMVDAHLDGGGD
jgi:hypothetical protein